MESDPTQRWGSSQGPLRIPLAPCWLFLLLIKMVFSTDSNQRHQTSSPLGAFQAIPASARSSRDSELSPLSFLAAPGRSSGPWSPRWRSRAGAAGDGKPVKGRNLLGKTLSFPLISIFNVSIRGCRRRGVAHGHIPAPPLARRDAAPARGGGDATNSTYGQEGRGLYRKVGECVGRRMSV